MEGKRLEVYLVNLGPINGLELKKGPCLGISPDSWILSFQVS